MLIYMQPSLLHLLNFQPPVLQPKMKLSNILLTIFQLHGLITQLKDPNLIETTCRNTPDYTLCISTVTSSPNSATTMEGLGLIMVDAVKTKAETALSIIEELKRVHPKLTQRLQECTNTYKAVVKADVPEAVSGLTKGVPKFAEFGMSDAKWEAEICEASLGKVVELPLSKVNKDVRDLALVAIAIIKNLL